MKKLFLLAMVALLLIPAIAQDRKYNMYGVMFYNLENLFDTINTNRTSTSSFSLRMPTTRRST